MHDIVPKEPSYSEQAGQGYSCERVMLRMLFLGEVPVLWARKRITSERSFFIYLSLRGPLFLFCRHYNCYGDSMVNLVGMRLVARPGEFSDMQ
jgi:hypothetical protein